MPVPDLLRRGGFADLEVRSDGRTIIGLAAPFDRPANIGGQYVETIRAGAFHRTIAERGDRVKLLALHNNLTMPLGRATALREETRGLVIEARISKTTAGDEVLELIRDGALDSLSIGFHPVRDRWNVERDAVERLEVRLIEVSLVTAGAYDDARVLAVRTDTTTFAPPAHLSPAVWATRLGIRPTDPHNPETWTARFGLPTFSRNGAPK